MTRRRALRRTCHRTLRRTWASGPGRRAPSSPRHHRRRPVFVQFALRWGQNWAAQWHLARAVGKRFRGYRAKCLYVDYYWYLVHCGHLFVDNFWTKSNEPSVPELAAFARAQGKCCSVIRPSGPDHQTRIPAKKSWPMNGSCIYFPRSTPQAFADLHGPGVCSPQRAAPLTASHLP